ncbi:MAG: type III pantothenate kinase [Methyloprofundus sp.]|nr:type III pantothenate kinase [Methyloprofundus sp.]
MILLIDLGNTRLKWLEWQAGQLGAISAVSHIEGDIKQSVLNAWRVLPQPQAIYLSVVGSSTLKQLLTDIVEQLWSGLEIQEVRSTKTAYGVTNAYAKPEKLGVDRWLVLLAAQHHYSPAVCIVDCGTAITLDVLDQQGMHLGGMIMPGLNLMQQALQRGTANLTPNSEHYQRGLANDTEAAIFNGNLSAIKGFIEVGRKYDNKLLPLIVTGGDAELIVDSLKLEAIVDTKLIFKGLALFSKE